MPLFLVTLACCHPGKLQAHQPRHVGARSAQGVGLTRPPRTATRRYRLLALDPAATRALPATGKVVVKVGGASARGGGPLMAQALLQLPEVPVRSAAGAQPPVVWVNIGLLAEDGVVLQLKLKRAEKPRERDRVAGVWYAYHPVGGALTVLQHSAAGAPAGAGTAAGSKAVRTDTVPAHGLLNNTSSKGSSLIQAVEAPSKPKPSAPTTASQSALNKPRPAVTSQSGAVAPHQPGTVSAFEAPPTAAAAPAASQTEPAAPTPPLSAQAQTQEEAEPAQELDLPD